MISSFVSPKDEAVPSLQIDDVVSAHLDDYLINSVAPFGSGTDHSTYLINDDLVVRFDNDPNPATRAAAVTREAALLHVLSEISTLPIPIPVFADPASGCLAYHGLPGTPLIETSPRQRADWSHTVTATLGPFLATLHATNLDCVAGLVDFDNESSDVWREEAADHYAAVAALLPAEHRRPIERFLTAAPPLTRPQRFVLSHNDLGIEHILVDPDTGVITGIIDWADAAMVDPAADFARLLRDLGPAALDHVLDSYHPMRLEPAARDRIWFYARCGALEDITYAVGTGRRHYLRKGLDSLNWLFA